MGWCLATDIFDPVCTTVLHNVPDQKTQEKILKALIENLQDQDWDCECDSDFWDHAFVGPLLGNTFEDDE